MSNYQDYKDKKMAENPDFWKNYDKRFETFTLGLMLKEARQQAGLTQDEIAKRLNTTKSVISRMENHATDIRLSTLEKFAQALGKQIHVALIG